ncbi:Protein transport protein S9 plasma membrane t-SNARE [Knufia obscura]|uniref:Protein transport protein S9 plasma membrane t-SNARE n=2 Tax=Knufia TaxID=430999 RepID=A0AAN8EAX4_9EURO|nr:Protein transport protein S9 plasma membrane t-SNARE [Knufia obscura]KAK5950949.1 Protein transport protein S9 plasma membrane t-SNARE [Knufia fluminis]
MGLFKKKNDDGDDSNRSALFGRNKSKSPAPPNNNPYANPNVPPDPYTQAKMSAGIIQPPQGPQAGRQQQGEYGGPQGGYGSNRYGPPGGAQQGGYGGDNKFGPPGGPQQGGGYGPNRFGNEKGYGAPDQGGKPYGGSSKGGNPYAAMNQASGSSRMGGYGGLGPAGDDTAPDENRDALFGGAQDRLQQRQPNAPPGYQYNGGTDPSEERSYGAYGDRQLTAEEEEEEDITATKQEIRFMKQKDVSSTRNALQAAAMAEETGRGTLARLGAQGERIHNTDRNLDIGHNAINVAEDRSKELKTLNRSMFAVHVNNPFTAKEKRIRDEEKILNRHQLEREQREATREAAFSSTARMNQNFKGLNEAGKPSGMAKTSLAERSKYQFEADSDDDRMEDEIERNIDELGGAAKRLNVLARAMGEEADTQNSQLQKVADKSDRLDDRFHLQTERLKRIK